MLCVTRTDFTDFMTIVPSSRTRRSHKAWFVCGTHTRPRQTWIVQRERNTCICVAYISWGRGGRVTSSSTSWWRWRWWRRQRQNSRISRSIFVISCWRTQRPGHLTSSLCQPRSSRRALTSSQQLWSAGFFCGRPCDMELVTRQSERSCHQQRLLQAFTEDVFILSLPL